jgi:hypothetical protein
MTSSATLLLNGCSLFIKERVVTVPVEFTKTINIQPRPKPVRFSDIRFYVVTDDNIKEFLEEYKKTNGDVVFYAISVRDYENLALNLAEARRYLNEQKSILVFYEDAITKDVEKPDAGTPES